MTGPDRPNWRRELEAEARAGREARAELARIREQQDETQRELALRRAGVDVDSKLGRMFAATYDGPLDQQAIKAEAYDVPGLMGGGVPQHQQAAMQRIQSAQAGGYAAGGYSPDFAAELDAIPLVVAGEKPGEQQMNPNYVAQVLAKTAEQAAREGREMNVVSSNITGWANGSGPVTTPLSD